MSREILQFKKAQEPVELWCVGICPEADSPHEQSPAISKEIAERAVERYRKEAVARNNEFILEVFDEYIQVQKWDGTAKEHRDQMFYTEEWFSKPFYQCRNFEEANKVFKFGEIVECHKENSEPLITADFEEAKRFYGA